MDVLPVPTDDLYVHCQKRNVLELEIMRLRQAG